MTVSTGMLKFQPLVEAVIVISHRPEVKRYCSLILNSYLVKNELPYLITQSSRVLVSVENFTPAFTILRPSVR